MNESPFAHRIARKPKTGAAAAPAERRTTPVVAGHIPLTSDDLGHEEETPRVAKSAAPAPVAAPQESSAMRQTLVAVAAFVGTTLVLIGAAIAWKLIFTSK